MHFALLGQQVFGPLIPEDQKKHPVWVCLQLHLQYFMLLMQTSFKRADIARLDCLIYAQQELFLAIPQYFRCLSIALPLALARNPPVCTFPAQSLETKEPYGPTFSCGHFALRPTSLLLVYEI